MLPVVFMFSCLFVDFSWTIPWLGLDCEMFKMFPSLHASIWYFESNHEIHCQLINLAFLFQVLWWVLSEDTSLSVRHFNDSIMREIAMRWWFKYSIMKAVNQPCVLLSGLRCHWSVRPVLLRLVWLYFHVFELSSIVIEYGVLLNERKMHRGVLRTEQISQI